MASGRDETELGGPQGVFRTTQWAQIRAAADPSDPHVREHLDRLFRAYWKPVYSYVRAKWRASVEDAKDATQSFFTHLLRKEPWGRLRAEMGSFRGYLLRALQNFMINRRERDEVRQSHAPTWSLDAVADALDRIHPAAPGDSPERTYNREWFRCLMEGAIADLKLQLEREGKTAYFAVFAEYCLTPDDATTLLSAPGAAMPTYREVAARLKLQETDVRNYLSHCRRALREIVRERVKEYAATDDEVERELREAARG